MHNFKKSKTFAAFILSAIMISTLAGCGSNEGSSQSSQVSGSSSGASASTASKEEGDASGAPKKVSIAVQQNPNVEDFKTTTMTQWLEKDLNADLEFVLLPSTADEANTKIALWVSSGTKLPDVLNISLNNTIVQDYASKGVLVDLTSFYADPEIGVNMNSTVDEDRDFILSNIKQPDGKVYSLFRWTPFPWNESAYRAWVNVEWLTKLGITAPKTTDEFKEMLSAFAANDLNGNGKKDEIALMGCHGGWAQDPTTFIMNAFINTSPNAAYMVVENGKLSPAFTTEQWKKGLEYMYGLVQDGLISPLSFTQDSTQLKTLASAPDATIGVVTSGSASVFGTDFNVTSRMALLEPLTGPDGFCSVAYSKSLPAQQWYVTKDASDPAFAFKCGDWFMGIDQSWSARYGEKGVQWSDDPEVLKDYIPMFEEYDLKYVGQMFGSPNFWGQPQNYHWQSAGPIYTPLSQALHQSFAYKEDPNLSKMVNNNQVHLELYDSKKPEEYVGNFIQSEEELEKLTEYADMITYVESSMAEFITGNRPLSKWDEYLETLKKMNLDEFVAIKQSGFDRAK